jgi:hypothetical protein
MRGVGQEGRLFAPVRTAEDERVLLEDLLLRLIDNDRVHAHKRALLLQEIGPLLSRCGLPAKAHRAGRRRRSADDEDDDNNIIMIGISPLPSILSLVVVSTVKAGNLRSSIMNNMKTTLERPRDLQTVVTTIECSKIRDEPYKGSLTLNYKYRVETFPNGLLDLPAVEEALVQAVAARLDTCDEIDRPRYAIAELNDSHTLIDLQNLALQKTKTICVMLLTDPPRSYWTLESLPQRNWLTMPSRPPSTMQNTLETLLLLSPQLVFWKKVAIHLSFLRRQQEMMVHQELQ